MYKRSKKPVILLGDHRVRESRSVNFYGCTETVYVRTSVSSKSELHREPGFA